jgi:hypothetical protein
MALPTHLQRYDGLIDLLVEQLVREIGEEGLFEAPGRGGTRPGVNLQQQDDQQHVEAYASAARAANSPGRLG